MKNIGTNTLGSRFCIVLLGAVFALLIAVPARAQDGVQNYNPEFVPTPTPTPTATPTPTPTATATTAPIPPRVYEPPPPSGVCETAYVIVDRYEGRKAENIYLSAFGASPCVTMWLHSVVAQCRGDNDGSDDCSAGYILGDDLDSGDDLQIVAFDSRTCKKRWGLASGAELNMFRQCLLGEFTTASPISLIFGPGDEDDGKLSFTKFPLNPNRKSGYYSWRGSERAPLLVYDPKHTGNITSAGQLFGEWTFGGRQLVSLWNNTSADSPARSNKWENGYEALGTMDENHDGKISGKELEPLALWFDKNRDGVSQSGEVKPIVDQGITALFYKPNRVNSKNGSIYADQGFERTVNGKTEIGMSVDWFGKEADSPDDLVLSDIMNRVSSIKAGQKKADDGNRSKDLKDSKLTGLWEWKQSDSDRVGALMLFEKEDGSVNGFSLIHAPYNVTYAKKIGYDTSIIALRLRGTTMADSDGKRVLKFQVRMADGGITDSMAILSPDGTSLSGSSVLKSVNGDEVLAKTDYKWKAEPMKQ